MLATEDEPGAQRISRLLQVLEDSKDVWLCYEVGQQPLSKLLFDVKGEFYHGERVYSVQHKGFYQALAQSSTVLKDLIRMLAEALDIL